MGADGSWITELPYTVPYTHGELTSRWSVAARSPCCEATIKAYCVELSSEDFSRYSIKIESVGLRKWPHFHYRTKKVSQWQIFRRAWRHIVAGKQLAWIWYEEITQLPPCVHQRESTCARKHANAYRESTSRTAMLWGAQVRLHRPTFWRSLVMW